MGHPTGAGLQRQHAPAVAANRLRVERRWGRPCLAYTVCIRPGASAAAALSALQASLLRLEPSLLRVPAAALHTNVVWLLPVHEEFGRPKDELWRQHGAGWVGVLADAAAATGPFRLCYRRLVATDSAIIAIADEPNRVSMLRRALLRDLRVPGSLSAGELAHMTLFRYGGPLGDPASLLRRVADARFHIDVAASELLVVRERIFPSLSYEIVRRLCLLYDWAQRRGSAGSRALV